MKDRGWVTARSSHWLLAKNDTGRMEILTIRLSDGQKALPVFSFREEAEMFLHLGAFSGWRVRLSGCGELISILYGPCAGVKKVVLDPLPARFGGSGVSDLLSLSRKAFLQTLVRGPGARWPTEKLPSHDGLVSGNGLATRTKKLRQ